MTFRKVAAVLSFTRAAAELNYAQSSVTSQIRNLEASLQAELFDRLGGRIQLTEAGRRLVGYADQILALVEEARAQVPGGGEPAGTLAIGTMESITSYRLPPLLEMFHHRYPRVQLSLRPSLCAETCQRLRQGTYDVGFMMEAETEHEGVETEVLVREPLVLVAAPHHPMAGPAAGPVTLEALRSATVLAAEPGCAYRDLFERELSAGTAEPFSFLEFGTIEGIKRGAIAGLGVSLLPQITVAEEIAAGELAVLPWEPPFEVFTQLAWRQGKRLSRELRMFIDETVRLVREEVPARSA
ncbi:transcriptional regulator, LysR family (plasmid) [Streptantibioticus cattleyicolor NRRL 8057 = DSM 46488]|uniref:Transcriptional regulator, LysR family n=1 Tax=Streptantibioticus cattleyicolor (strain ATCC 35852 / DSM 46488 / JCM 4925 / NBRC 14057 / NRRL 8057) TaxID=1003195 RepID=G8XFH0_STREN|nr:LysR family transcriptional regulator [Streptantibioticus cattleyicolor]AEW98539.1 transcriptional regulator, LysR family [Streptantibioticus cattleyicolor NRRL 8057 = DSM 46488]